MPHVLWELQGYQTAQFSSHTAGDVTSHSFEGFELVIEGSMEAEDFDEFVADTVNFLAYIAEPIRSIRVLVWILRILVIGALVLIPLKIHRSVRTAFSLMNWPGCCAMCGCVKRLTVRCCRLTFVPRTFWSGPPQRSRLWMVRL